MKKALLGLLVLLLLCGCTDTESAIDFSTHISAVEALLPNSSHVEFLSRRGITHIRVDLFVEDNSEDFGISLYKIYQYSITSLKQDSFEIEVAVFNNTNIENWCYVYSSSATGYGTLTDKRGSHEKNIEFSSLDTMREYFPLLNRYLLEQNINPEDLTLYHDITQDLKDYRVTYADDNIVFAHVANLHNMSPSQLNLFLLEAEQRIASGNVYSDRIPLVFPRSLEHNDVLNIEEIPEVIYTTTASENGLADNVYFIDGEVVRYETREMSDKTVMNLFVIKNELGEVIVLDSVGYTLDYGKKHYYSKAVIKAYQEATANEDFSFPEIGQQARIYCIYGGFSGLYELPIVYYGITDYSNIG